jgi:primosomal protein N' (replication factor Y)
MLLARMGPEAADAEVIRMDADATRRRGAHQSLLERFDAAECAILVGTQMIAKGLDFPEVTLVGVVNADTTLKLPDFRAAERTWGLLEQVAGRAGRGERAGRVIVQSYWATHPAIRAVAEHRREVFLVPELAARSEVGYPPYTRLSNVVVWGEDGTAVEESSKRIAEEIRRACAAGGAGLDPHGWEVLGPAPCVRSKVKDKLRRHVMIKTPLGVRPGPVLLSCVRAAKVPRGVNVAIDVDATDLM